MRLFSIVILSFALTLNLGCIHVAPSETKNVELPSNPELAETSFGALKSKSLLYRPSKFPLDDFFSRVARGEFRDAFSRIDLDYQAGNVENQALRRMIDEGYFPLYLEVENTSMDAIEISDKDFVLDNGRHLVPALSNSDLPSAFKRFNPESALANVANVSIVVVASVAVIAAMAVAVGSCRYGCDIGPIHKFGGDSESNLISGKVLNPITKTTKINYKSYLFRPVLLAPGDTAKGLLFFKIGNPIALNDYKLALVQDKIAAKIK